MNSSNIVADGIFYLTLRVLVMMKCATLLLSSVLTCVSATSFAYDGQFLQSFAVNGREQVGFSPNLNVTIGNGFGFAAPAVQADGKLVIEAPVTNGTSQDFGVLRLNANGTLDTNFGTVPGGQVIVPFDLGGKNNDVPSAVALDSSGRIVVAGTIDGDAATTGTDCGIIRLTPSGALDTTFSGDGKATVAFNLGIAGQQNDTCYRTRLQTDNKILVVGGAQVGVTTDTVPVPVVRMAVARLTTSGTRDTSFNGNGLVSIDFGANYIQAIAIGVVQQSDNSVLAVGSVTDATPALSYAIVKLTPSGALDNTFGNGGTIVFTTGINGYTGGELTDIVSLPDNSFVVSGVAFPSSGSNLDFVFAKFLQNGSLDGTFGTNGVTVVPFDLGGVLGDLSIALIMDDQGRFIANGVAQTSASDFLMGVTRLTPTGQLDTTFGNLGTLAISTAPANATQYSEQGLGIALTSKGSLLVTSIADVNATGDTKVGVAELVNDTIFSDDFEQH